MKLCFDFWVIDIDEKGETHDREPTLEEAKKFQRLVEEILINFFEMDLNALKEHIKDLDEVWNYKGTWYGISTCRTLKEFPNPDAITDMFWWFGKI